MNHQYHKVITPMKPKPMNFRPFIGAPSFHQPGPTLGPVQWDRSVEEDHGDSTRSSVGVFYRRPEVFFSEGFSVGVVSWKKLTSGS